MKALKNWRLAMAMLAALSLASCGSDDDDSIPAEKIQQAYFQMKDTYGGTLTVCEQDTQPLRTLTFVGLTAQSAEQLTLSLPLDLVADQISDASVAARIREIGFVQVTATYEFCRIDDGGANFLLRPQMVFDEQLCGPLTRTQPVTYQGLTLLFSQNYGGNFVKANSALDFTLCVGQALIDGQPIDGFRPLVFHFSGMAGTKGVSDEQSRQMEQRLTGTWWLDEESYSLGGSKYRREWGGYVYRFSEGNFRITEVNTEKGTSKEKQDGRYTFYTYDNTTYLYLSEYIDYPKTGNYNSYEVLSLTDDLLVLRRTVDGKPTVLKFSRYEVAG